MEISIYYSNIRTLSSDDLMNRALTLFPDPLQKSILRYRTREDRLRAFAGKLLLLRSIKDCSFDKGQSLYDLKYTPYNRPYFDGQPDFNITHSGDYALLGITTTGKIGIDIERIAPLHFHDLKEIFTIKEWDAIRHSPLPEKKFYEIWTKKESIVKAVGRGLNIPFTQFQVDGSLVEIENQCFRIFELDIDTHYYSCFATNGEAPAVPEMQGIDLTECIYEFLDA
ncbi:4'-phosphopantetheinyl transferase family protein [Flavitalea flava]